MSDRGVGFVMPHISGSRALPAPTATATIMNQNGIGILD